MNRSEELDKQARQLARTVCDAMYFDAAVPIIRIALARVREEALAEALEAVRVVGTKEPT